MMTCLMRRSKGTEFERTLTKDSAGQRSGIIGTLNVAGPAFPAAAGRSQAHFLDEGMGQNAARLDLYYEYDRDARRAVSPAKHVGGSANCPAALHRQPKGLPFTWMFLDELAAFQHLPKLKLGITEGRKAGLSIFLGFHGKSQIEGIYGKDADTLFRFLGLRFSCVRRKRERRNGRAA
jgi:hypothetical protein